MRKLTDWLITILIIIGTVSLIYAYTLPPIPSQQLQEITARLDRIEAATQRAETVGRWVYDQQSYTIMREDWRGGK
jgi:hypothetical protein